MRRLLVVAALVALTCFAAILAAIGTTLTLAFADDPDPDQED